MRKTKINQPLRNLPAIYALEIVVRQVWIHQFLGFLILGSIGLSSKAYAVLFLTGSISSSTSNVRFQTLESRYGSGSVGVDLGRYIRLQYTYSQEFALSYGYKDKSTTAADAQAAVDSNCSQCIESQSMTRVIGNSIDLQLVLYEGLVLVPYVMMGGIVKTYEFRIIENGEESGQPPVPMGPLPNLGAGLGIRLNREFTLKLSYITSPGVTQSRGEEPRKAWDRKVTLGLTYQI